MKMTKQQLAAKLNAIADRDGDPERDHSDADDLLLEYIGSPEVEAAYGRIEKWNA